MVKKCGMYAKQIIYACMYCMTVNTVFTKLG